MSPVDRRLGVPLLDLTGLPQRAGIPALDGAYYAALGRLCRRHITISANLARNVHKARYRLGLMP